MPLYASTNFQHGEPEVESPIPPDLLIRMHDVAAKLVEERNMTLHSWGLHLMEDWRGLELLAEHYR